MDYLASSIRFVHVVFGFIGLFAFWIPVLSKKGARLHVLFGKIFVRSGYVVLAGAALALLLRLAAMLRDGVTLSDQPAMYGFIVFLGYLTLVTFVTLRHGMAVLRHKGRPQELDTPLNRLLAWSAVGSSIFVIVYALVLSPPNSILLFALSPIGFSTGIGALRYFKSEPVSRRGWMYEHLGALLGAGIAFHTAFAVFGMNEIFEFGLRGWLAILPWVAPTIIGVPAIVIWSNHYRRKFGEMA